jgi:DNA-binding MarR family transcriptional regulator
MSTNDGHRGQEWWDAWRGMLFASNKVLKTVERDLKEHSGFSLTYLDVLSRLYDAPGRSLRMLELQERSLFTYTGMTRLVDRIERDGLVRRERVPGDRRGVSVVLTSKGAAAYEQAFERHKRDVEREFAGRLTFEQHRAVADALAQFWHDEGPD